MKKNSKCVATHVTHVAHSYGNREDRKPGAMLQRKRFVFSMGNIAKAIKRAGQDSVVEEGVYRPVYRIKYI